MSRNLFTTGSRILDALYKSTIVPTSKYFEVTYDSNNDNTQIFNVVNVDWKYVSDATIKAFNSNLRERLGSDFLFTKEQDDILQVITK